MGMKIRKLSAIGLTLALGLAVIACGGSAAEAPAAPAAPQPAAAPQAPSASALRAQHIMPSVPAPAAPSAAPPASSQAMPAQPAPAPIVQVQRATSAPAPAMAVTAAPSQAPSAPAAPAGQVQLYSMSVKGHSGQAAQSQSASGPRGGQPGATTFEEYERIGFEHTAEDRVSTFSLDTDRTSYHLALNWARAGYDVEPDSVRAEEWINSFDYGYAQPSMDDSFAVHADVMPHPLNDGLALARIAFQAPELRDDGRPLNVTLALDASGSMADGDRIDIARTAAETIRKSLRRDDRIAVVHFTDGVIDDLTVEHDKPDSRKVRRSIDRLEPHGSTNVQAGLDAAVKLADWARYERPNSYNYIILMSDGVANVDATNPFGILEAVGSYDGDGRNPLRLITIGVGIQNYNDYLLEQLAQHGNGWYRYLNDTGQAQATFSRENWLALSIPFADQTRAQVTWNPDVVESWRIVGYENRITSDENFAQARKEFAEIPSGAATTVFYELELVDYAAEGEALDLGDVEVRWVTPMSNESNRQHAQILAKYDDASTDMDGALLKLGALVALASDRYSSLPYPDALYDVRDELSLLKEDLRALDRHIGELAAYRDFSFLMDHIAEDIPRQASGYSR